MEITVDEVVKIHDKIIEETGGHSGIISYGNLDFIVSRMKIAKIIERKAAILFYGILTAHPFLDGNKRTAIVSLDSFLRGNNRKIMVSDDELWDIAHRASEEKLKFEDVVNWFRKIIK